MNLRSDVREVGLPPADSRLLLWLFVFAKKNGVERCSRCWKPDLAKLNANVTRPDLQQPETNSTPFVISKTNSSVDRWDLAGGGRVSIKTNIFEVIGTQPAETRPHTLPYQTT